MPGPGWCGPRTRVVASGQSCLDPLQFGPRINIPYFGEQTTELSQILLPSREISKQRNVNLLRHLSTQQNSPRSALGA
jgi:hypothetical protein